VLEHVLDDLKPTHELAEKKENTNQITQISNGKEWTDIVLASDTISSEKFLLIWDMGASIKTCYDGLELLTQFHGRYAQRNMAVISKINNS
jgi:hypothetical protein